MEVEAIAHIVKKLEGPDITSYAPFFTLEGGEGSGKSSILALVSKRLMSEGIKTVATREPGGTSSAKSEAIRSLLYQDAMGDMEPLTAAFLYAAARTQHVQEVILPHLKDGYVVLCDRYVDSSLVYQGMEEDNLAQVTEINAMAIANTMPATTLLFDAPADVGLKRIFSERNNETNYMDHKDITFHQAVYDDYQVLAEIFSKRYVTIDATQSIEDVAEAVYETIKRRLEE